MSNAPRRARQGHTVTAAGPDLAAERWTERRVLDLLRERHLRPVMGTSVAWAYAEHVHDRPSWPTSTIDALAMHLWPSKAHEVHAYEVKVSRSDFRRELADDCSKSAFWRGWVDYFSIVAPHGVVPLAELPYKWGLLEAVVDGGGEHLRVRRAASKLTPPRDYTNASLPLPLVSCLLRGANRVALRELEVSRG